MIRATLFARNQLRSNPFVAVYPVPFWDGSSTLKLLSGKKAVVVLNPYRLYSAARSGASKPAGFMAAGPIGMDDHSQSQKGKATSEVRAVSPMTFVGKLGKIEPVETTANCKRDSDEVVSSTEKQAKKTDPQDKAKEAQEAAAKKLQDIVANLPSKQQTEKYFFRVVAFIYDLAYLTGTWMLHFIDQNIVRNEKVQHYWKRFHEKMDQAKKD